MDLGNLVGHEGEGSLLSQLKAEGLAESLACSRREEPRQWVAAGSVGIAGQRSGLYALDGPGGWQIVGRTDLTLFDPAAAEPFRLGPGDRIRFVAQGE